MLNFYLRELSLNIFKPIEVYLQRLLVGIVNKNIVFSDDEPHKQLKIDCCHQSVINRE